MATRQASGTLATDNSVQNLGSEITDAGSFQLVMHLDNMAAGETLEVTRELDILAAGSARQITKYTLTKDDGPCFLDVPIPNVDGLQYKVEYSSASSVNIEWAVLKL